MHINYSIAFLLGLFSSIHCLGMCGSIMGALSMGLPASVRADRLPAFLMVCGYNLGRILSYACAGVISGSLGLLLIEARGGHLILRIIAGTILVILGFNIGGWLPRLSMVERLGMKVWRVIQPLGKRFLPVDSFFRAIMIGMVWGWLPCGLVYSVLLWAAASGDPVRGGFTMLSFGFGTLPTLIATGMAAGMLQNWLRRPLIRKAFAVIIILFGAASPWLHLSMHAETGHESASSVHQHE